MKGFIRTAAAALAPAIAVMCVITAQAAAFEGGGRKPSEAPIIAVGQNYTGQLTNRQSDANFGGEAQVAMWRLPPLATRDVVYINWHSVPLTYSPGDFPVCMTFAQGIDDYSWGSRFDQAVGFECEAQSGPIYELSGSGTARTEIIAQEASDSSYIEFFTRADETEPARFESFPYDFSLEPPLHYLGVAIREVERLSATGVLQATATLANGQPVPDGVPFGLAVTWDGGGSASYTAVSSAGTIAFRLGLPETSYGHRAVFEVNHPADGSYIEASSRLNALVTRPRPPALSLCSRLKRRERSLRKRHRRMRHRAQRSGRSLHRRATRLKRRIRATRRRAKSACRT